MKAVEMSCGFFQFFLRRSWVCAGEGENGCFGQKRACAIPESAYCVARRNDGHKAGEVGESHGLVLTFVPIFRIGYDSHRSSLVGCQTRHDKCFYEQTNSIHDITAVRQ